MSPFSPGGGSGSGSVFAMLPMTPQSAALGPAVQATVPSTPQSANFAAAFNGGVFERADALMASLGGGGHRQGALSNGSYGMRERDEGPRSMVNADPGMGGMGGGGGGGGMNGTGTMVPFRINGDGRERGKVAF